MYWWTCYTWMEGRIGGYVNDWLVGWMDGCTGRLMMDVWLDGQIDGLMDKGWIIDGRQTE